MLRKNKLINFIYMYFMIILLVSICSCVADGAARVKGRVITPYGVEISNCQIEIYLNNSNEMLYSSDINGVFDVDYTISPWSTDYYYFVIKCKYCESYYKSEVYRIGGVTYNKNPLDLGDIIIKRDVKKQGP